MKTFAVGCLLVLSSVGMIGAAAASDVTNEAETPTIVERVADALFEGDRAGTDDEGAALGRAALMLGGLGARPLDTADERLDVAWQETAREQGFLNDATPYRGRALGPAYRKGILAAGEMHSTEQLFFAGKKAEIAVVPASGAELTLTVRDAKGQEICSKHVDEPRASCRWNPYFTDRYSITVTNRGQTKKVYYLVVN